MLVFKKRYTIKIIDSSGFSDNTKQIKVLYTIGVFMQLCNAQTNRLRRILFWLIFKPSESYRCLELNFKTVIHL